jgi:FAD/FMN-containing dehydrogenase
MPPRGQSAAGATIRRVADHRLVALQGAFEGQIVRPDDPDYDTARQVWNAMIDRRPALVVRPIGSQDVAAAIRFGREEDLEIAVRGGGHSVSGHGSNDDGLVIDLGRMRGVRVDPASGRVLVQGGALLVDVDREVSAHGLAVPAGVAWDTGVGGLTLGGGYGWLSRLYGLTSDNLLSVELVSASGDVLRVDDESDAELMWGLRGGGGNFGVVTWFEFQAHPVPPQVHSLDLVFDAADATELVTRYLELSAELPRSITTYLGIQPAEETPGVPDHVVGGPIVWIGFVAIDTGVDLVAVARPLTEIRRPYAEIPWSGSFRELQRTTSEVPGSHRRRYWKAHYVDEPTDAFVDAFVGKEIGTDPRPFYAEIELFQQGGAIADRASDATAFANRSATFDVIAVGYWDEPDEDEARMAALRGAADRVAPFRSGVYLNNLGDEGEDRVREAFRDGRFARLQALKSRMDPDNVLHRNANIPPA